MYVLKFVKCAQKTPKNSSKTKNLAAEGRRCAPSYREPLTRWLQASFILSQIRPWPIGENELKKLMNSNFKLN